MTREMYQQIEQHMLACMDAGDLAHGPEHVYRVLNAAMEIADNEDPLHTDYDVLICASLLHDIGRRAQTENPVLDHAVVGADMAETFLTGLGFSADFAARTADCIRAHRYRGESTCETLEAKILYDADKLDATGALGIARTLLYGGAHGEPLYSRNEHGAISDGRTDAVDSFCHEYNFKLKKLYTQFNTRTAASMAAKRRKIAQDFYEQILDESRALDAYGWLCLKVHFEQSEH